MVEPLELGRFISTCRKEKNLTQKQLGEELGVTDRAVSKWENGKSFPDISLIEPLCQILDISVSEFMLGKRIEPEHYQEETEIAGAFLTSSFSCHRIFFSPDLPT